MIWQPQCFDSNPRISVLAMAWLIISDWSPTKRAFLRYGTAHVPVHVFANLITRWARWIDIINATKWYLILPWQNPSFPQLPCDDCPPDRLKHCRGAQQSSEWTHPVWLAPGFSAAAGWPGCTETPALQECWSCKESSSSSAGPVKKRLLDSKKNNNNNKLFYLSKRQIHNKWRST